MDVGGIVRFYSLIEFSLELELDDSCCLSRSESLKSDYDYVYGVSIASCAYFR